jgi:ribonuclease HII
MKVYIDEAGRWPLAWPLYVWLVIPLKKFSTKNFKDSKKLSEKQREECFSQIKKLQSDWKIIFATWSVSHKQIDKYWLTKSINLAIKSWLKKLAANYNNPKSISTFLRLYISTLVIDGNTDFWLSKDLGITVETIIKWDDKVPYISMASIVAKVSRDRLMKKLHNKYPLYWFDIHKWYWTKLHYANIKKHGISPIHRMLFLRKLK